MGKFISKYKKIIHSKLNVSQYQKIANSYWETCENSYVGAEGLYLNQEETIKEYFIPKLSITDDVLDIGCSDGRFSFLVAPYCKTIEAFDLSTSLINSAVERANTEQTMNVRFTIKNIQNMSTNTQFNHVMCMGVFTAIPEDKIVIEAIKKISKIVRKNGYVIIKDSLAIDENCYYHNDNYAAVYRNEAFYKSLFTKNGFEIESEFILHSTVMFEQMISSKIIILKKNT